MKDNLQVAIGDSWQPRYLSYFAMVMMALMLATNVLNLKFVDILGVTVIASQITYVLSMIIADIMAEVYGYRRVRRLLYTGLACLVGYALFLQLAVALPPAAGYAHDSEFATIFAQTPRIILASIVAYFFGELLNSYVMSGLKIRLQARHFYGRALAAVGLSQAVNGIIFFAIAYGGSMPLAAIASAAFVSWLMVMGCEIVVLPLTRKLAMAVKRAEGIEHYDRAPAAI